MRSVASNAMMTTTLGWAVIAGIRKIAVAMRMHVRLMVASWLGDGLRWGRFIGGLWSSGGIGLLRATV